MGADLSIAIYRHPASNRLRRFSAAAARHPWNFHYIVVFARNLA
jgi:hypothetical protein